MKRILSAYHVLVIVTLLLACGRAWADAPRELAVHLAQANNDSPYAFVRAKFEPGEVTNPWAVRFFDAAGKEVPYFVWDSITWKVAREGRPDWGHRYALLNHSTGIAPEVLEARGKKIEWAKENMPAVGARLEAQEKAAKAAGDSICAAMYLVRRAVPAFGKDRLTLRMYPERQIKPQQQRWQHGEVKEPLTVEQGKLAFQGLPDGLSVSWQGRELFRATGFDAGGTNNPSHFDAARPFTIEATAGLITKLVITSQTSWRQDGSMDWQNTYWLFPEGGYVALQGYSLGQPSPYRGGHQKLSILAAPEGGPAFTETHAPDWDRPWWIHQAGKGDCVATHLFFATPLSIGYGNNPFTVNAEGNNKEPRVDLEDGRLALRWHHEVNDSAILRLMERDAVGVEGGHLGVAKDPATGQPFQGIWEPKVDWLYRQYVAGVGEKPEAAEATLRGVLGAAAGWIDRPVSEEELATMFVSMMPEIGKNGQSSEIGLLRFLPAVLNEDKAAIQMALRDRLQDFPARTDFYIDLMRKNVELGGKPAGGGGQQPDGSRREGWTGNPCYHATLMPCAVRTLEFFDVPFRQQEHHDAILRYADFGLELLGGKPVDLNKFRTELEGEWPSRTVPTIPLMLHAYTLKPDERYAHVAKMLFDDHLRLVERNPHGYFPAWTYTPKADKYDTVYNPVAYERGLTSLWSEHMLDLVGRENASRFVAAQARWFVFSGHLLDTLEIDNLTAIRACNHGGHTSLRNQIGIYLLDDFAFYRGLLGDLITWSAISRQAPGRIPGFGTSPYRKLELSNAGSSMVRWALDIRPGGHWLESKVQPTRDPKGFNVQVWNRLPKAHPTVKVTGPDAGLKGTSEVLHVRLLVPAYREPAEVSVSPSAGKLALNVSKSAFLRVYHRALLPGRSESAKGDLRWLQPDGTWQAVADGVTWTSDYVEFQAAPGKYELR